MRDLGLDKKAYVLAGSGPLASAKPADWIRKNVAGIHILDQVIERLRGAKNYHRKEPTYASKIYRCSKRLRVFTVFI